MSGFFYQNDSTSPAGGMGRGSIMGSGSESPPDVAAAYMLALPVVDGPPDAQHGQQVVAEAAPTATSSEKPYHSKRPHKKSRTGCKNCKARKVKCDEDRPACRSCRLRGIDCIYPFIPGSTTASASTSATSKPILPALAMSQSEPDSSSTPALSDCSQHASLPSLSPPSSPPITASTLPSPVMAPKDNRSLIIREPAFRPSNIDEVDMKLLWFYTATTSTSFSVENGYPNRIDDILKVRMVQVAFETPFLMDSLFALSSLHLQKLNQKYDPSRSMTYRIRSFKGYRKAIEEARPETFPALIGNSLLMTALASQPFREKDSKPLYIIDWMVVWRGIGLIIDKIGLDSFFKSGLVEVFYRPPIDLDKTASSIPNYLLFMISSIMPGDPDHPEAETYYETLKYLGSLYSNLHEGMTPTMNLRIITWFTFLPRRFTELCRELRPRCLVILAHYAAFLKLVNHVWWIDGIGDRSLKDICEYLGPEWQHLITVPQTARQMDSAMAITRILLEDRNWVPPRCKKAWRREVAPIFWVDNAGRRMHCAPNQEKVASPDAPNDESLKLPDM